MADNTILHCAYDPNGQNNFQTTLGPISQFNKKGSYDITDLTHRIVTEHFKYKGSEKYKLTLRRDEMTLALLRNNAPEEEFGKLQLQNGQWQFTVPNSEDVTVLKATQQISSHLETTLQKIDQAWKATHQADPASETNSNGTASGRSHIEGETQPTPSSQTPINIHNNVQYGPDQTSKDLARVTEEAIHAMQEISQQFTRLIERLIEKNEQDPVSKQQTEDLKRQVKKLEKKVKVLDKALDLNIAEHNLEKNQTNQVIEELKAQLITAESNLQSLVLEQQVQAANILKALEE